MGILMRVGLFLFCFAAGFLLIGLSCFRFMESTPPRRIIIGWTGIILWLIVSCLLAKKVTLPGRK